MYDIINRIVGKQGNRVETERNVLLFNLDFEINEKSSISIRQKKGILKPESSRQSY